MAESAELPTRSEVVIIGGGIMGASAAYYLSSNSDLDITVLEKDNIATGSTGDSSANIRYNYGPHAVYTEIAWWSREVFANFETHTGHPLAYVECPRVRFGKDGTAEGEFILAGYEVMRDHGIPVTLLDQADLAEAYPMFARASEYDYAVVEEAAAYSDGTDAANGLMSAARANGAEVRTGVTVQGFDAQQGEVGGVRTDQGRVRCEQVIVCAGPWTPRLGDALGVEIPIIPTREQVLILEPPARFVEECYASLPMTRFPGGEWYMRPDFGEGVLVATHPFPDTPVDPDTYSNTPDESTLLAVQALLAEHVPGLEGAGVRSGYCGVYSTTPDHDFIIDAVGPTGCYFACGFSGHGFKAAPAIGRILTDLVLDGATEMVDLAMFSLDRFRDEDEGHGRPVEPL